MTRMLRDHRRLRAPARLLLAIAAFVTIQHGAGVTRAEPPRVYAITQARIVTAPGTVIEDGTLVIRDGLIEAVGAGITPPADAAIIEAGGGTMTAGFIDSCTAIGRKGQEPSGPGAARRPPGAGGRPETPPGPVHPIARIRPERKVIDSVVIDENAFESHRKLGFTAALTLPGKGIFRGQAAIIALGEGTVAGNTLRSEAGQVVAFETGRFGRGYPTSLMGAIAAVRQTLLDAERHAVWAERYAAHPAGMRRPENMTAFAALAGVAAGDEPVIFDIDDAPDAVRAVRIADEFSLDAILIASGLEHVEAGAIGRLKAARIPLVLPLAYPEEPEVEDPDEALDVTLRELERWDAAPGGPMTIHEAGIPFALGTCRLENVKEFLPNLRKAIDRGLPIDAALAALTTEPARLFDLEEILGTLEAGKIANVAVFEGADETYGVFAEKASPTHVFVDGVKYEIERKESKADPEAKEDPRGTWTVTFSIGGRKISRTWTISGEKGAYEGTAETREGTIEFESIKMVGNEMTVTMPGRGGRPAQEIVVIISGDSLEGSGEFPGGMTYAIKGKRIAGPDGGES